MSIGGVEHSHLGVIASELYDETAIDLIGIPRDFAHGNGKATSHTAFARDAIRPQIHQESQTRFFGSAGYAAKIRVGEPVDPGSGCSDALNRGGVGIEVDHIRHDHAVL